MGMRSTLLAFLMTACSASETPPPSPRPPVTTRKLAMNLTVKAGEEQHRCQYLRLPPGEVAVTTWRHRFSAGSHHFIIYRTDLKTIPAGQSEPIDCYSEGETMKHVRGVLYGDQNSEGVLAFPDGVGVQLQSEEVVMSRRTTSTRA